MELKYKLTVNNQILVNHYCWEVNLNLTRHSTLVPNTKLSYLKILKDTMNKIYMLLLHTCVKQLVCIVDKTMCICFCMYERNRSLQAICIHYILYNCKKKNLYRPTVDLLTSNKNTMNILTCFTFIKYFYILEWDYFSLYQIDY